MSKKTNQEAIKSDTFITAEDIFYTDQLTQIAIGPHVSKLTFGMDVAPGVIPDPVATIVIPTASLINLAHQIFNIISDESAQVGIKNEISNYLSSFPTRN